MANTKKTTNSKISKEEVKEVEGAKHIFSQKNILIICAIILGLILVIFYGYRVNKVKETEKLSKS